MKTTLLLSGSREGIDYNTVARHLSIMISDLVEKEFTEILVKHGAAEGVDSHGSEFINKTEETFKVHGIIIKQKPYPVLRKDWYTHDNDCQHKKYPNNYCPAAGIRRNKRMVDEGIDYLLALVHNNSRGTTQCISYVRQKGIPEDHIKIIRS